MTSKEQLWQPPKPRISFRNDFFAGPRWECVSPLGMFGGYRIGFGNTPADAYAAWKDWKPWVNVGVSA